MYQQPKRKRASSTPELERMADGSVCLEIAKAPAKSPHAEDAQRRKAMERSVDSPCDFADRIGRQYASRKSDAERKANGVFFTPEPVARFMAGFVAGRKASVRLLDPAAGVGMLICAAVENLINTGAVTEIAVTAFEIDHDLVKGLKLVLEELRSWAAEHDVSVEFTIKNEDFLLSESLLVDLLSATRASTKFDFVIANPPYFKIGKNDPRAAAASEVVYGQPNIYSLFMAVSANMLKAGGHFLFVVPRSFASGPYFARFRRWLFERIRPTHIHVFDSRKDAFGRDEVLQENVIFSGVHDDSWRQKTEHVSMCISSCHGLADLADAREVKKPLSEMIAGADTILRIPGSSEEEEALARVERWHGSLEKYGLKISTGPVVAFRATRWLRKEAGDTVPLIWLNHVFPMELHWPNGVRKPQYIERAASEGKLLVPNKNYVLLRRFSAKEDARRLTAAPLLASHIDADAVGLENHLNYIYRPGRTMSADEVWGLTALYSSSLLDNYFRCVNGNTQVSATELRTMPLPPLEKIIELGKRVQRQREGLIRIDATVEEVIG